MSYILDQLFRPIARLCIARGWRFADVAERLRKAFVDEALTGGGAIATDSRIAVMTGLQRRDVARLRATAPEKDWSGAVHPCARLVAIWLGQGVPRRIAQSGPSPSFDALARQVRQDIHPRTLLDALEDAGTVAVSDGWVTRLADSYDPLPGSDDQLAYLAANVGDHLAVAVSNVVGTGTAFERSVHYRGLSADAIAELRVLWSARITDAMAEVNAKAHDMPDSADGPHRFRAGAYFFEGDQDECDM